MRFLSIIFAALITVASTVHATAKEVQPIQQLRIYEIFDNNKAAFHDRFRDHTMPIMKRYGFQIVAMWETRQDDKPQLVYLLQWADEATMKAAWKAFMADAEWSEIKRVTGAQHGRMVGKIEDRTLVALPHSPAFGAAQSDK